MGHRFREGPRTRCELARSGDHRENRARRLSLPDVDWPLPCIGTAHAEER